jgi:myo-inositol 2-dehydrogenase/D-chiro-inositol 1-dehydrogenase
VALAAVCDLDEGKARAAQAKYGFEKVYTDFRTMLDQVRPQAVFCVGGPTVHHPVGMEVLDRGYPLYIQKSPAPSSTATRELAELAARKGVVCHVGFNLRFSTAAMQARTILAAPEFGTPLLGIFRYGLAFGKTMADVVLDQHCHLVDLARFLLGEIAAVSAVPSARAGARDYVATVRFASETVGTLNFTSGQIPGKEFLYFEITGPGTLLFSHGCAAALTWRRALTGPWWKEPQADHVFERGPYGYDPLETLGYVGDVDNFVAAVKGIAPDLSPVASTVGTKQVCEDLLRQVVPLLT